MPKTSTGLPALNKMLHSIVPGDNVVWQVDAISDYTPFVNAFCAYAEQKKEKVVYFRFACHPPLLTEKPGVEVFELKPEAGFELFITQIHQKIKEEGKGRLYVFDSMSDLAFDCFSDRMVDNFFMLTCPYLFELQTIAYFAIMRYYHSYHATSPIAQTTQLLLDVYRYREKIYVQPSKVLGRYSSTMYMLHVWEKERFAPVTESGVISEVLSASPWPGLKSAILSLSALWSSSRSS